MKEEDLYYFKIRHFCEQFDVFITTVPYILPRYKKATVLIFSCQKNYCSFTKTWNLLLFLPMTEVTEYQRKASY